MRSSLHEICHLGRFIIELNMPLKCLLVSHKLCGYKKDVFQELGQSLIRLLGVEVIMRMRSLKLVLLLFLMMMIMIVDSSSMLIMYRKLKPLSGPLNYVNKVKMKY